MTDVSASHNGSAGADADTKMSGADGGHSYDSDAHYGGSGNTNGTGVSSHSVQSDGGAQGGSTGPQSTWAITDLLRKFMKQPLATEWFGIPVDPVALNIPTYFTVIKEPMDLGTILKRLDSNSHYQTPDEVVRDIRLTFNNAMTFNPATNEVHKAAKRLLTKFEQMLQSLQKRADTPAPKRKAEKAASAGGFAPTPSNSVQKRQKMEHNQQDIYDQADRDGNPLPVTFDQGACMRILKTLMEHDCAGPFMYPVDPVALEIPDYFERIKRPMDLSTVKKRINENFYRTNDRFAQDIRQIWANCITYNGPNTGVSRMARQLSQKFERLYSQLETGGGGAIDPAT